jgi:hypothetical protein
MQYGINGFLFGIVNEATGIDNYNIIKARGFVLYSKPVYFQLLGKIFRIDKIFGAPQGDEADFKFSGHEYKLLRK